MAILAKADITISRIVDVKSVTTYYLLQSSTAAKPNKPTAIPPGGNWNTTEPTYESGSTSTLYTVILTIMSNDTYSYSDVSKSSSYEAAKEAWNKANRAQAAADAAAKVATNFIQGTDDGLIVGNMEADTLGANVKVDSDSMEIRNGDTVLAKYAADKVELGKNSKDAVVEMCGGTTSIVSSIQEKDGESVTFSKIKGADGVEIDAASHLNMSGPVAINLDSTNYYENDNGMDTSASILSLMSPEVNAENDAVTFLEYLTEYYGTSGTGVGKQIQNYIGVLDSGILLRSQISHQGVMSENDKIALLLNNADGRLHVYSNDVTIISHNSTGNAIGVGVGTGGVNRGLHDEVARKWQLYSDETDLYLGPPARDTFKPYYTKGDKIPCEISTGGYVTGGGNQIIFSVPLSKPLVGVSAATATTNNGFRGRQGGKYTHGSSASTYVKPASYSCYVRESWIEVRITISSTANVANNDAIGVAWSGYLTFS
ncbi:hypothetical protein [Dorea sp. AM10-31]|uniref:hypothetical protein n=1 Tax=Dorea sp. AM10-31 TaxID=2293098 RepID=UPI000E4270F9|nr:hypothetical protein [Dorea sp. AM10-31]RGF19921.1 hypothetical protein DW125_12635 [Dorea sp. AM10-31]